MTSAEVNLIGRVTYQPQIQFLEGVKLFGGVKSIVTLGRSLRRSPDEGEQNQGDRKSHLNLLMKRSGAYSKVPPNNNKCDFRKIDAY